MKIVIFHPESTNVGWSMAEGLVSTAKAMGHEVSVGNIIPTKGDPTQEIAMIQRSRCPAARVLEAADAILVSGPEHIITWIVELYGDTFWKKLKVPKLAWYHESFIRDDYTIDFDAMRPYFDEHFFPAAQDAEFYDQEQFALGHAHWLPFGVDTTIYKPKALPANIELGVPKRDVPLCFIGMAYGVRQQFLAALSKHHPPLLPLRSIEYKDLDGHNARAWASLMVDGLRRINVFMNLPSLSRLIVMKVFEAMACGCFVMTPSFDTTHGAHLNLPLFKDGEELVYYRSSNLPYVAQLMREWPSEEKSAKRETIAEAGCKAVHAKHSLKVRYEEIFAKIGMMQPA